jgi:hypothetical protein
MSQPDHALTSHCNNFLDSDPDNDQKDYDWRLGPEFMTQDNDTLIPDSCPLAPRGLLGEAAPGAP